ncbi:MAG: peptide chain release factor N(5)-glutamine methyltransferase [Gammaproteobacteria bacterium]|jgi:release factor glutamine methyltransferase|nr:peptide chain release factor N(5)-glutamine methyltransferase [Gammaproteobacteria bacterium]
MIDLDLYLHVFGQVQALKKPNIWAQMILEHLEAFAEKTEEANRIFALLVQGVHLARILGWTYFSGHCFLVFDHVLIPRFDTEVLVEAVVLPQAALVIDWCSGTGCIGLSLALRRKDVQVLLLDKYEAPCENAAANIAKFQLGLRVKALQADCFEPWPFNHADVIVANPPYLSCEDPHLKNLMDDPISALVAADAGMAFYYRLISQAVEYLRPGGRLYLEIGFEQASAVSQLARDYGWQVQVVKDMADRDRVLILSRIDR